MSSSQRLVAIAVGLLAVVAIVVVGLNLAGDDASAGAGASPSAQPTSSDVAMPSASGGAEPSATADGETIAVLREIEDQVIEIRGLERADIGAPEVITRAQLAEELETLFEEDYPPEEQAEDTAALRALGLLEPGQEIGELQLQLLGDQVLGFYDDNEKRMVVVSDAGLDAQAKVTYAHEYTHALQDAAFGIDSLDREAEGQDDRSLARTALLEGDASVTMLAWAFAHLSPQELTEIGTTQMPDTTGIPSWMVSQLGFPYNEGLIWAGQLAGPDPFAPNFAAIDAAYADPPESTEQIIDPAKWEAGEEPVDVEVVDLAEALGEGWTEVEDTPIGEATIRIMLEYLGVAGEAATAAASGWGGDRAVIATGAEDAFAVAWRLEWDSAADATEFADAYGVVVEALNFPATVTGVGEDEVLVVHASSEEILRRALDAANG